jgi:hypothetical protein
MSKNELKKTKKLEPKPVGGLAWFLSYRIIFILHAFLYIAVNALLILIWAVTLPTIIANVPQPALLYAISFWPIHTIMGWGIAFGFHTLCFVMYNDKIEYLALVRRGPLFGILFVFHAWFYGIINIYLIVINAMYNPTLPFFLWPLLMWGLGFAIHAVGFFTWRILSEKQITILKRVHPDYSEKHLKLNMNLKLAQFWLLIAHIAYYIVVNILTYIGIKNALWGFEGLPDPIQSTIGWGIVLGIHALSFYLFNYAFSIKPEIRSLLLDIVAYGAANVFLIIRQSLPPYNATIWIHYPLILWGVIIAVHIFLTVKYDSFLPKTIEKVKGPYTKGLEEFEVKNKAIVLLFWQYSFVAHILVYAIGIILIGVNLINLGIGDLLIHPAMGWLIAVGLHGAIFVIFLKQIRGFLACTAILHLTIFVIVSIYLVVLNALYVTGFAWSAIAIGGWGIALGLHILIAYLAKHR